MKLARVILRSMPDQEGRRFVLGIASDGRTGVWVTTDRGERMGVSKLSETVGSWTGTAPSVTCGTQQERVNPR